MTQIKTENRTLTVHAAAQAGSEAGSEAAEPSPGDIKKSRPDSDKEMDDNIDDKGRRPDGSTQDQPGAEDMPDLKDVAPGSDADSAH